MLTITDNLKFEFQKAKKAMLEAQRICIISHYGPDGDAVGSNLALKAGLEALGKEVVSACKDPAPQDSMFLKNADRFVQEFKYDDFDLFISVDCGASKLMGMPEILEGETTLINFDHHESNNNFGKVNPVDAQACATALILYKFFVFCGWKVNIEIATCLLHGIYFDTGGMMHSNTTSEVFRIAGELISKGANLQRVSKELFHTTSVNKLRLWGRILERTYVNDDKVTVSAVNKRDYDVSGTDSNDATGVIDYLNAVPDSNYCVLLKENEHGQVKGSLRTRRDDVNLSEVASKWGGGGHPKASGFGVDGVLKPVMSWEVVTENGKGAHGDELKF